MFKSGIPVEQFGLFRKPRLKRHSAPDREFSRVTQELLKSYSRVTQELLKRLLKSYSRVTQEVLKSYSRVTQELLKRFSRVSQEFLKSFSCKTLLNKSKSTLILEKTPRTRRTTTKLIPRPRGQKGGIAINFPLL